jgi:hypothetical protein
MRAVWLEMRDEEPPGGGLAELLAAARVKAEAMQPRPSRWQRLVAMLRRPPVLALATAMVLLAGAAIFGRRAVGPMSRADEGAAPHADVGAGSAVQAQLTEKEARTGEAASRITVRQDVSQDEAKEARTAAHTDATSQRTSPGAPAPTAPSTRTSPKAPARHEAPRVARSPAMETMSPAMETSAGARPDRDDAAKDEASPRAREAAPAMDTAAPAGAPAPSAALPARPSGPSSTELSRLHQQCETAARRGDCPAVRQLVERITRADRGYRGRIAKDSAVAKCLE